MKGVMNLNCIEIGKIIKKYRCECKYTQKRLADELNISDKTVSKWENGRGCPDISLLPQLSRLLGVDISAILEPQKTVFTERKNSMKNCRFYVCPICKGFVVAEGEASISCCFHILSPLKAQKAEEHEKLHVEISDGERYITSEHPMTKDDYISFVAFCHAESISISRQYPEWNLSARFLGSGAGMLLWYSEKSGLLYQYV